MKRREFIKTVAAGIGGMSAMGAYGKIAPAAKKQLRVALVGCGGRGVGELLAECCKEHVVALADPDPACLAAALAKVHKVDSSIDTSKIRCFDDYRTMYEKMGGELDAAVIATPNFQHAPAALMGIRRGINVYVEKPLTHTIQEARQLRDEAKKYGVITQMGQHGHSNEGARRLCEYIWAGAIGQVHEVHCWTSRCDGFHDGNHSPEIPLPKGFNWEAWLGPALSCKYHADLHPHGWHLWHQYGNGSIGNMGCHLIDPTYWALKLKAPEAMEVEDMYGGIDGTWSIRTRIRWDFPAREGMDPVKVYFYDGLAEGVAYSAKTVGQRWHTTLRREDQNLPPLVRELEKKYDRNFGRDGSLIIGDKGIMTIGEFGDGCRIVPEEAQKAFPVPAKILPRIHGTHQEDFFRACRGGVPACANFDYSEPLAEIALLGNIAMLAGLKHRVTWDSASMTCPNAPELNRYLKPIIREGWSL